jgi:uncharacterized protein YcbK (DUF882 family)
MATRHRLSPHFTIEEFDCHDGTKVKKREHNGLEYLCKTFLEPLRKKYGAVTIHSGYRTITYNRKVGGAENSFHIYTKHDGNDQAADVSCERGSVEDWWKTLNWIRNKRRGGKGGLGFYPRSGFCHIDIRDYAANWKGR